MPSYKNPFPTVDIIIFSGPDSVVLIERSNPPHGWAIPGGFIDYGESAERAAVREAREETGLDVVLTSLVGVYSDPDRDPRKHTLSVAFSAVPADPGALEASLKGGSDAARAKLFSLDELPPLVFDHAAILDDFKSGLPGRGR